MISSRRVAAPRSATPRDEWLRYVEHDRKREHSTVLGYRRAVEHRCSRRSGRPARGDHRRRRRALARRLLARRSQRRHDQQASAGTARRSTSAPRASEALRRTRSRSSNASRSVRRTTSTCSSRPRRCCWRRAPATTRTRRSSRSRRSPACGWASYSRCAGGPRLHRPARARPPLLHPRASQAVPEVPPRAVGADDRPVHPAAGPASQREHFTGVDDLVFVNPSAT